MKIPNIVVDGIEWEVEEVTRDSAVMTNHINGEQTVVFRLVCKRKIS